MDKPVAKHHHEPCLSYNEVIAYIEDKYRIDTRDYQRPSFADRDREGEDGYRDFWHWILDVCGDQVHNGAYFYLDVDGLKPGAPLWVREILELIKKEFPLDSSGGILFYTSW